MKCEEYQEAIAADPSFDGGAGHLTECEACQAYRSEMISLDRRIGRALALDVPELRMPELPHLSSQNVAVLPTRRRVTAPAWLAVAATVVIAAVLGVRLVDTGLDEGALASEVLAHLQHEPNALQVTNVPVSDERLESIVSDNIAQFDRSAALITYAQSCVINGHEVPHLVVQGKYGPVTILLLPEEAVSGAIPLADDHNQGVILPVGHGSIAIIGGHSEGLEDIQRAVLKSVTWST